MENPDTKITSDGKVVMPTTGTISALKKDVEDKFKDINRLLVAVVFVLVVMVATMIIMVAGLIMDAWRFNSVTYKEYSEKIDTLDILQKSNNVLMKQNEKNQEFIMKQQSQMLDLLRR